MKNTLVGVAIGVFAIILLTSFSEGTSLNLRGIFAKFDEFGYNRTARIFNGSASGWCLQQGAGPNCLGIYSNDRLKMKWNAEWDRGNEEGWTDSEGYNAWLDNNWNGKVPGGSGEVWQYRIKWIGPCSPDGTRFPDGGYCIWGQFEVIMSQGTVANQHFWDAHAVPSGFNGPK